MIIFITMEKRLYNFCLITYLSPEEFCPVLLQSCVKHYAFILHDKDVKDDEPVEPHYHILLMLWNNKSISAVRKMFPANQSTLAQAMRDKSDCFVYLDHSDKPDKFQYSQDDIICDDWLFWNSLQSNGENPNERTLNILDNIAAGLPLYELAKRYGREVVINYDKYFLFVEMCKRDGSLFDISDEDRGG